MSSHPKRPLNSSDISEKKVPKHVFEEFQHEGYEWYYDLEVRGYFATKESDTIAYTPSTRRVWRFIKP